ncbi:unnamed protein product [Kuraishia capsulata CBS 1993]|uniref:NADH dehydrogenase [ubiquinone] 1 alpha subcomplex subunit n=1 Tax=Kuraishia capsulata CBS 1993 TaxID=1382522 RepID=W6MHH1_9ASCO|nr:uncharacterized protein KUCA_T00001401001 [Kuraishia capsulata CBS 1993]CDK25431.1 unnamed protein product [Kuraishia capsulata CBS 1993]
MSTSLARTLRNFWRSGVKRSLKQIAYLNDTKSGTLVGIDDFGNKFYETQNPEEIHLRTRWVEYIDFWRFDMSQVEPGWHYWLAYGTDTPPNKLTEAEKPERAYPVPPVHKSNLTYTKGAYIPYNTARPKYTSWAPEVKERVTV